MECTYVARGQESGATYTEYMSILRGFLTMYQLSSGIMRLLQMSLIPIPIKLPNTSTTLDNIVITKPGARFAGSET